MTQEKAKMLIKIGKYFLICILAIFFVIIIVQSAKINSLTNKRNILNNDLQTKQVESSLVENKIEQIKNNKDKFSEEELRKDNYKKNNETLIKGK